MTLTMYERIGFEERRPSPFSWRIRYALAHKGIQVEFRPVRFADVETIRALSGQDKVAILVYEGEGGHDTSIFCQTPDLVRRPAGLSRRISSNVSRPRIDHIIAVRGKPSLAARWRRIVPDASDGWTNSPP